MLACISVLSMFMSFAIPVLMFMIGVALCVKAFANNGTDHED